MRWKLHQGKKGWQRGRARPEKHLETHACVYSFYLFPAFWFSLFCCLFLCPFHSPPFTPMLSLLCLFSFVFFPLWWFSLSRELIPSCLYPNSLYTLYSPMWPALFGSHYTWHQHASPHAIKLWWSMIICPTYPLKNWCRTVCLFPAPFSCPGWYRILTFHSINRVKKQCTRAAHQNHCTAGKQWFCWWHISVWSAARLNFSHHSGYHSWVAGDFTPFCGLACLRCSTAYIFIHLLFTGQGISASPSTFWTHNLALTAVKARLLQQHVACKCRVLLRACF